MEDQIVEIKVATRMQDNQDGGWTMYAYNNNEELLADHPGNESYNDGPLSEERKQAILNEENPYEDGYIGTDTIKLKIENGKISLAEPISFHAGQ